MNRLYSQPHRARHPDHISLNLQVIYDLTHPKASKNKLPKGPISKARTGLDHWVAPLKPRCDVVACRQWGEFLYITTPQVETARIVALCPSHTQQTESLGAECTPVHFSLGSETTYYKPLAVSPTDPHTKGG